MSKEMSGVFTIPVTPFTENGELDEDSLCRVTEFCVAAGGHGVVAPVNASEFSTLSDDERKTVMKIVVEKVAGRIPVVLGVSGVSTAVAVMFSQYAESIGADAVIAMPPYVQKLATEGLYTYYAAISGAIDLPIFVQNYGPPIGTPMSSAFVARMAREIEHVEYIKEETPPVTHQVSAVLELGGEAVKGVFGGAAGRYMLDEMRRGAIGTMPACDITDLHVEIWSLYQRGEEEAARLLFNQILPLLNMEAQFGVLLYKEVLKRRGVIRSAYVRNPSAKLDSYDHMELDEILAAIRPLFRVT